MAPPNSESGSAESALINPSRDGVTSSGAAKVETTTSNKATNNTESSPEEIARQHAEALDLVKLGIQYAQPKWEGEIPLTYKQRPVCPDRPPANLERGLEPSQSEREFIPCWSSRGYADVTALQALVRNGYNRKYLLDPSATKTKATTTDKNAAIKNTTQRSTSSTESATAPINYWDPVTAAAHNVPIRRKSHDAWGIPKIVLLFCDDFCQDQYELPWWWKTKSPTSTQTVSGFAEAIQPVLDALQIPVTRVVRMLLASLPPGSTIPVHHDTGEWVKYSHRIHVPVLVSDVSKILFRCGPTVVDMAPIECTPGHVFEINNQAKHAVSNCDVEYRVHLILDYVDEDFVTCRHRHGQPRPEERIRLQPGETLMQTRRSIDRLSCKGQRPTPSFMILGAQKAGTTFLFEVIMQHPLLIKPKDNRRETHCLDWRWNDKATTTIERQKWCREFYYWQELQLHPSCLTGDSTPSYLLDSRRVIPRIQQVFPWRLVFFIMCRDPVARAESHYAMVTSPHGTPAQLQARGTEWRTKSIDQVIFDDFTKLQECGLLPYWSWTNDPPDAASVEASVWGSAIFDTSAFASFSGSPEEDAAWDRYLEKHIPLSTGSYGLLSRGLYELQLRPWFRVFDPSDFLVLKLEAMTVNDDWLATTIAQVWNHLVIPPIAMADDTSVPKNSREYDRNALLSHETRDFLSRFYQPHNERLLQLLRDHRKHQYGDSTVLWDHHWSTSWGD